MTNEDYVRRFFNFLIIFEYFMVISNLVKPKFDQHLNKSKKGKSSIK